MFLSSILLLVGFLAGAWSTSTASSEDALESIKHSVYLVYDESGHGSGFAVDSPIGPVVITNRHVCGFNKDRELSLKDAKGNIYKTKIIMISSSTDLCALTAPENAKPLPVAESISKREEIFTVGYPIIQEMSAHQGRILGIDSKNRQIAAYIPDEISAEQCLEIGRIMTRTVPGGVIRACSLTIRNSVLTDMIMGVGSSGSPVINDKHEVVGVIYGGPGVSNMLVLANIIHIDQLRDFISSLK